MSFFHQLLTGASDTRSDRFQPIEPTVLGTNYVTRILMTNFESIKDVKQYFDPSVVAGRGWFLAAPDLDRIVDDYSPVLDDFDNGLMSRSEDFCSRRYKTKALRYKI